MAFSPTITESFISFSFFLCLVYERECLGDNKVLHFTPINVVKKEMFLCAFSVFCDMPIVIFVKCSQSNINFF